MEISTNVLPPRQSEAGKIKIGRRSSQTREARNSGRKWHPPEKLETKDGPYFIITKTVRGEDGSENFVIDKALMEALAEFKDKDGYLRRIPIMLESDVIPAVFPHALMRYKGDKRWCVGTGHGPEAATRYDRAEPYKVACPCDWLRAEQEACKPGGTLWCTILAGGATVIGERHAFRTHAWGSIGAIKGSLLSIQNMVGTIFGIRMFLTVKHTLKRKRDGSWQKVPLVSITMHADDIPGAQARAVVAAKRRLQVLQVRENVPLGLPAPGAASETPQEQAEVAAEWFPSPADAEVEADEDDFDQQTGEVKPKGQGQQGQQQQQGQTRGNARGQHRSDKEEKKPLAKDDALMVEIGKRLKQLAEARGFDPNEESFKKALVEVLDQVTSDYCGIRIPFGKLTRQNAESVLVGLNQEIAAIDARDEEGSDEDDNEPEPDDVPAEPDEVR